MNWVPGPQWQSIPGGTFSMGDAFGEGDSDELPMHSVTLTAFEMMSFEVTNGTYADCVATGSCTAPGAGALSYGYGSTSGDDPNRPVNYVDWNQATAYCTWAGGRLPTEAEWEYAARGGLNGKRYPWGDSISSSDANYDFNIGTTVRVGSYAANGYGLYDITGNVWEWNSDWYGASYYSTIPANDPTGPVSGSSRVIRGGSFLVNADGTRVARRTVSNPTRQGSNVGFRCVR